MASEIIPIALGENWVKTLIKRLIILHKNKNLELNKINDSILFSDPIELAKMYVEPYCQEINPADRNDEDFFVSKVKVFEKINYFLELPKSQEGSNQLFILSDAGMGKTSLLVMLKLMHLTSFWPKDYDCVLIKLDDYSLESIKTIENKRKTVLLLDSLDEDPIAYGDIRSRLIILLEETKLFNKVIITCRTQFFPDCEDDPFEVPGRIKIDKFICPSKYLSIFDDKQVYCYLKKRFPVNIFSKKNIELQEKGNFIIKKMGSLRCRPMLLSYIDSLIDSKFMSSDGSEYSIYESLVNAWLLREEQKNIHAKSTDLLKACSELAFVMQTKKYVQISSEDIESIISNFKLIESIKHINITGRSLLNRNSSGRYRFSHYSIQEFLVAYYIVNFVEDNQDREIYPTDNIIKFLKIKKRELQYKYNSFNENIHKEQEKSMYKLCNSESYSFQEKTKTKTVVENIIYGSAINKRINESRKYNVIDENELDRPTFIRRNEKSIKNYIIDEDELDRPTFLRRNET